jgi:HJR/Mrr/RecB family endonuclease
MSRRTRSADLPPEAIAKLVFFVLLVASLFIAGIGGFDGIFSHVTDLALSGFFAVVLGSLAYLSVRSRQQDDAFSGKFLAQKVSALITPHGPVIVRSRWTEKTIIAEMHRIDWFQFEKLSEAILSKEGWRVSRKGGATPDGGVDLIAENMNGRVLVQCKAWRKWKVKEKTVRELLGSMTDFRVSFGAMHTLAGWTAPAAEFASRHAIELCDARNLARRAQDCLSEGDLAQLLDSRVHHCPRCEAPMIRRVGGFKPFWGCSRYPICRGKIED